LHNKGVLTDALFASIIQITHSVIKNAPDIGNDQKSIEDATQEWAGEFIVALMQEEISGTILTQSDLQREFRRWTTRKASPQLSELWRIVSAALLAMEKEGLVVRPVKSRQYSNSNSTTWALNQFENNKAKPLSENDISSAIPRLSSKSEHHRILKPLEARTIITNLLGMCQGEITMADLVSIISKQIPMLHITQQLDVPYESEQDSVSFYDHTPGGNILGDYLFIIEEEAQMASKHIWIEAAALRSRNGEISGHEVLCGYLLPKEALGQRVKLATFGPSSSVHDLAKSLYHILAQWIPNPSSERETLEIWLSQRITQEILEQLLLFCSEKGFCRIFNDYEGGKKSKANSQPQNSCERNPS
jgi:hypothetical protein